jgi:hypothetical protein
MRACVAPGTHSTPVYSHLQTLASQIIVMRVRRRSERGRKRTIIRVVPAAVVGRETGTEGATGTAGGMTEISVVAATEMVPSRREVASTSLLASGPLRATLVVPAGVTSSVVSPTPLSTSASTKSTHPLQAGRSCPHTDV